MTNSMSLGPFFVAFADVCIINFGAQVKSCSPVKKCM